MMVFVRVRLMVGVGDLKGPSQPRQFYDSIQLSCPFPLFFHCQVLLLDHPHPVPYKEPTLFHRFLVGPSLGVSEMVTVALSPFLMTSMTLVTPFLTSAVLQLLKLSC